MQQRILRNYKNRTIREDTIVADENNDWLHKNDSYVRPSGGQEKIISASEKDTTCDLTYESMFGDVDDSTPTSKILEDVQEPIINKSETHDSHVTENKHPREGLDGQQQLSNCTPDSSKTLDNDAHDALDTPPAKCARTRGLTPKQIEVKRTRERARYACMTDEQKQARRDRQTTSQASRRSKLGDEEREAIKARERVSNMTPKKKQCKVERRKLKKEMKKNILRGDSIAMQNPAWVPEPVFLPSRKCASLSDKCSEFIDILEYKGTSIHVPPAPKETDKNVEEFDMTAARRTKGLQNDCESIPFDSLPPPPIPTLGPDDDDDFEGIVHGDDSDDEGYLFAGQEVKN
ncbi:hypothetical protein ACP4OV_014520 [Aristida adscensionis]